MSIEPSVETKMRLAINEWTHRIVREYGYKPKPGDPPVAFICYQAEDILSQALSTQQAQMRDKLKGLKHDIENDEIQDLKTIGYNQAITDVLELL